MGNSSDKTCTVADIATDDAENQDTLTESNVEDVASNNANALNDAKHEKTDNDFVYEGSILSAGAWDGSDNTDATNNIAAYELSKQEQEEAESAEPSEVTNSKQDEATNSEQDEAASTEIANKRTPPPRKTPEERGILPEMEEEKQERGMTLMEHLGELRTRLVRSFIAVGLAFAVCYTFSEQLFAELCKPLLAALPEGSKLIFTALPEAFFVYLKVGLVAAVFVASPFLFYQIWSFIAPGLYDDEKKYVIPMALISAIFFISGASFCFFVVFPYAFTFFVGFASEEIAAMPSLGEYLGFSLKLLIAFGLIFEMPLFTFFLSRLGLVTAARMRNFRRYAILCIFIIAAILTPPDVISQLLMAMPMMILYEVSIGVAAVFGKKKKQDTEDESSDEDNENDNMADNKAEA